MANIVDQYIHNTPHSSNNGIKSSHESKISEFTDTSPQQNIKYRQIATENDQILILLQPK